MRALYTINPQAVLGQVATGGAEHLEEQFTCLEVPLVTNLKASFIHLVCYLEAAFEQLVTVY